MTPQIKNKDTLFLAEKLFNLKRYEIIAQIVMDVLQGIILDLDTNARAIHGIAVHETKLTLKKMRENLRYVSGAIDKLNATMSADMRSGQFDKAYISDIINDYIRLFSPAADYSDKAYETLIAAVTMAFQENKRFAAHQDEFIHKYAKRLAAEQN